MGVPLRVLIIEDSEDDAVMVVRVIGGNRMGIHLDRLPLGESERLQEFLLPMIPGE